MSNPIIEMKLAAILKDVPGNEDAFDRPWYYVNRYYVHISRGIKRIICNNHLMSDQEVPITYFEPQPDIEKAPIIELKPFTKTLLAGKCTLCNTYYWSRL